MRNFARIMVINDILNKVQIKTVLTEAHPLTFQKVTKR